MSKRECFGKYVNSSSVCYNCEDEAGCIQKTVGIKAMDRVSKDDNYLDTALTISKRSSCIKRRYGCIIVKNDEIVSTGYNGSARGEINCSDVGECPRLNEPSNSGDYSNCPAVHAEQNAMLSPSRKDMIGSTMYLAGDERKWSNINQSFFSWNEIKEPEPCPICLRLIKNSGIEKVITRKGVIWERDN